MSVEAKPNVRVNGNAKAFRNPVDVHIGNQVRLKRIAVGQSKEEFSRALGVTIRQLEKYENGSNRLGPSRLLQIAKTLNADPSIFFEGSGAVGDAIFETDIPESPPDCLHASETLELLESFFKIREAASRAKVVELARELAHNPKLIV